MFKLIHDCKVRVYVSFHGTLKIKHDTFPINLWFDIDLLYFIYYVFAHLCGSFSNVAIHFLHQANRIRWGPLLSPIPFVGRYVFPSVSLLIFEEQLFVLAAFVWSRCPQSSHSYRTYRWFCGVSYVYFLAFWDNCIWNFLTKRLKILLTSFRSRNFCMGYIWNICGYQSWDTSGLIVQLQLS